MSITQRVVARSTFQLQVFTRLTQALINTCTDTQSNRYVLSLFKDSTSKQERILFIQLLRRVWECEWIPLVNPPKRAKRPPHYQLLWWAFSPVVAWSLAQASPLCCAAGDFEPTVSSRRSAPTKAAGARDCIAYSMLQQISNITQQWLLKIFSSPSKQVEQDIQVV